MMQETNTDKWTLFLPQTHNCLRNKYKSHLKRLTCVLSYSNRRNPTERIDFKGITHGLSDIYNNLSILPLCTEPLNDTKSMNRKWYRCQASMANQIIDKLFIQISILNITHIFNSFNLY